MGFQFKRLVEDIRVCLLPAGGALDTTRTYGSAFSCWRGTRCIDPGPTIPTVVPSLNVQSRTYGSAFSCERGTRQRGPSGLPIPASGALVSKDPGPTISHSWASSTRSKQEGVCRHSEMCKSDVEIVRLVGRHTGCQFWTTTIAIWKCHLFCHFLMLLVK